MCVDDEPTDDGAIDDGAICDDTAEHFAGANSSDMPCGMLRSFMRILA